MAAPDLTPRKMRKLSVIVPVYNERNTVVEVLRRMRTVELPDGIEREIIVVDDGSTDGTRDVLRQLRDSTVRVMLHKTNRGKGAAVRTGIDAAYRRLRAHPGRRPRVRPRRLAASWSPRCCGGRARGRVRLASSRASAATCVFFHWVGNRLLSLVTNVLYNTTLSDMETCYKLVDRRARRRSQAALQPLRHRARDHRQDPEAADPHLRGADLLHGPRVRRGQEDHVARRLRARGRSSSSVLPTDRTQCSN